MNSFGNCAECGCSLEAEWFIEDEYETTTFGVMYKTGRQRHAVGYLFCPDCGKKYCVDDSFDGPWR